MVVADIVGGNDNRNAYDGLSVSTGFSGLPLQDYSMVDDENCLYDPEKKDSVSDFKSCCNIVSMDAQIKNMHKKWSILD
jgi:hypothetical protein